MRTVLFVYCITDNPQSLMCAIMLCSFHQQRNTKRKTKHKTLSKDQQNRNSLFTIGHAPDDLCPTKQKLNTAHIYWANPNEEGKKKSKKKKKQFIHSTSNPKINRWLTISPATFYWRKRKKKKKTGSKVIIKWSFVT